LNPYTLPTLNAEASVLLKPRVFSNRLPGLGEEPSLRMQELLEKWETGDDLNDDENIELLAFVSRNRLPSSYPYLMSAMQSDNPDIRKEAFEVANRIQTVHILPFLIEALNTPLPDPAIYGLLKKYNVAQIAGKIAIANDDDQRWTRRNL